MSDTAVQSNVFKEDLALATGGTGAAETGTRRTSTGGTSTLTKIDASHLKYRSCAVSVENSASSAYVCSTEAEINATITSIGSNTAIIKLLYGSIPIAADLTVPANITFLFEPGAYLAIATTKTVTLNGPIEAGLNQIFSCTGTGKAVVSRHTPVNPYWFYSGSGYWDAAFQLADAAAPIYGSIQIPAGNYSFDTGFTFKSADYRTIIGAGINNTYLVMSATFSGNYLIDVSGTSHAVADRRDIITLSGFNITGQRAATDGIGIFADYNNLLVIKDVFFQNIANSAIEAGHLWDLEIDHVTVYGCGETTGPAVFIGNTTDGGSDNGNGIRISNSRFERCWGYTLKFQNASAINLINNKIHGCAWNDADDPNPEKTASLVYIDSCRTVQIIGNQITSFRKDYVSGGGFVLTSVEGAIHVVSSASLNSIIISDNEFANIGDETGADYDTYAVVLSGVNSKYVLANNRFRDILGGPVRTNTKWVYVSSTIPTEGLVTSGNLFDTPSMAYAPSTDIQGECYTLPVSGLSSSWADSTTYLFGGGGVMTGTDSTVRRILVPQSGYVKYVILSFEGTLGSAENVELYIRHNNTTDYIIASDLQLNGTNKSKIIDYPKDTATGVSACYVTKGDYLHIKVVTPAWVTNPTNFTCAGFITIQTP